MQQQKPDLSIENQNLRRQIGSKDRLINELKTEIADLKRRLAEKPPKIHNERRAGRKPIATSEMKTEITTLRQKGLSCSEIAKTYSQNTCKTISKSTVYKLIKEFNEKTQFN
jgi:predicted RNase H-like nuclease (RuvC/YqgF family)